MAVSHSESFWSVLAKYPGAHHDNIAFCQSQLYREMENRRLQSILLDEHGMTIVDCGWQIKNRYLRSQYNRIENFG